MLKERTFLFGMTCWVGSDRDGLQNQIILTPKLILCILESWNTLN